MKRLQATLLAALLCVAALAQGWTTRVQHFSEADGYVQSIVTSAVQDSAGYVWLCTWNGLCRYDGYGFRNYNGGTPGGGALHNSRLSSVRLLPGGRLECKGADGTFYLFDCRTGRFEQAPAGYQGGRSDYRPDAATESYVKGLPQFKGAWTHIVLTDRQGGIWVDTHSGLYRVHRAKAPLRPSKHGNAIEENVRALYEDRQGRTWIADKNGVVRVGELYLAPGGRLTASPAAFGRSVYCILEDSRGDFWLGTKPDGLLRLRPLAGGGGYAVSQWRHDPGDAYSISSDNVYDICDDGRGRLWIATYDGGLNCLSLADARPRFVHAGNGLKGLPDNGNSRKATCLHVTPGGVLLVGTHGGLLAARLADDPRRMAFCRYERRAADGTSLGANLVMGIAQAGPGSVAVATSGGGLCLADTAGLAEGRARFSIYNMGRGLPSDACLAMVNAGGSLYIVSHSSISRFSLRDSSFTNYLRPTLADDFNLLETKPVATRGGRLLFGTTQGVLDLGPDDLRKSPYRPPLTIDGPDRITLGSDERSLTINFAALDFNKAMPITYAYRLDGDGGGGPWAYTTEPRVTLQDIAAGTHRLRIRWTNGDGVWMPGERVVDITRRPTWHERPLAWLIYGLLLALLAVGAWRVVAYIRRLQREIKDIRLSSNERLEVMGQRLRELLSIRETPERVEIGSAGESPERAADEAERHFAAQARAYMEANVGNADFSINDFAREMCVSRTVLFARMKSIFGTTPGNYLLNLRMSEAKRLLLEPGAGVADVAYRVGFSDPKYFGRCFKKIVGCAPSEYHG